MNPKISIIIPCYNVDRFLDRCLKSIINQTIQETEIILVDDGSHDRTPQICDHYAQNDKRIKVIHKKNQGLGLARNSGLEIATGEYIAFVDSDDYISENMYQLLYNETKNYQYDIVYCGVNSEKKQGHFIQEHISNRVLKNEQIIDYLGNIIACDVSEKKERTEPMAVWHAIYKKEIIDKYNIRFQSERNILSEDILFNIQYLPHCNSIRYIPYALYFYCYNENSLTQTFQEVKLDRNYHLLEAMLSLLEQQDLSHLKLRAYKLYFGYNRSFLSQIIHSNYPLSKKKQLCYKLYNNPGWIEFYKDFPVSKLPLLKKIQLFNIKNQLFFMDFLLYKLIKLVKR